MIEEYSRDWQEVFPDCVTASYTMKTTLPQEKKQEIMIYRAKQVHGNKYTYDNMVYRGMKEKIVVTCPEHGDFEILPNNFICKKRNCSACAGNKKLTTKDFVSRATKVHANKYTYDRAEYVGSQNNILVTCSIHGDFWTNAGNHLSGHGCQGCYNDRRSEGQELTAEQAVSKYTDRPDLILDRFVYKNAKTKATFGCEVHGYWDAIPRAIANGQGCPQCGIESKRDTTESFIHKAQALHGVGRYDYSTVVYTKSEDKVAITCKEHGVFYQTATSHLQGCGCPSCGANSAPADTVYLIHVYDNVYKIGITNNIVHRHKTLQYAYSKEGMSKLSIIAVSPSIDNCRVVEKHLHTRYPNRPDLGDIRFDGYTELRELTSAEALEIKEYLEGLTNGSI